MELPDRKANRLKDYDYSSNGAYFLTICTRDMEKSLGQIVGDGVLDVPECRLSHIGQIAERELLNIEKHYANVTLDKYVIMPNHIHLLVTLTERINPFPTAKSDIPNIVGKFKAAVTRNVGKAFMPSEKPVLWQSSYHDRIVRNEAEYLKIWNYIDTNPIRWKNDRFYCE